MEGYEGWKEKGRRRADKWERRGTITPVADSDRTEKLEVGCRFICLFEEVGGYRGTEIIH